MSLTNCRFYEEKYPDIDSFVMVNVNVSHYWVSMKYADSTTGQTSMRFRFPPT